MGQGKSESVELHGSGRDLRVLAQQARVRDSVLNKEVPKSGIVAVKRKIEAD